ncbi:MAG: tetratricopeptide repeat protein [Rhodospirillales bacterium]|nr:tetratricopeptide repeat protein [Rhodospirillales bacterium]
MTATAIPEATPRLYWIQAVVLLLLLVMLLGGCAGQNPFEDGQVTADPSNRYERLMRIADAASAEGDHVSAGGLYQTAHGVAPDRVEPLLALGRIAVVLGDAEGAARHFRMAVAAAPDNATARHGLGAALLTLNAPTEAENQFRVAIQLDPTDAAYHNGLGVSLDLLGRHDEARQVYRQALANWPQSSGLKNNLSLSLALTREFDKAITMLQSIADVPEDGPRVRQNLALVHALAGHQSEAAAIAAVDLSPEDARNNLAFYQALQGLSGPALAEAVFHANLDSGTPLSESEQEPVLVSSTGDIPVPDDTPDDTIEPVVAVIDEGSMGDVDNWIKDEPAVECTLPEQAQPTQVSSAPMSDPMKRLNSDADLYPGPLAFAEPVRAVRPAVRGLAIATPTSADQFEVDLSVVSPQMRTKETASVETKDAPTPTDFALSFEMIGDAPFSLVLPEDWQPAPLIVVAAVQPSPSETSIVLSSADTPSPAPQVVEEHADVDTDPVLDVSQAESAASTPADARDNEPDTAVEDPSPQALPETDLALGDPASKTIEPPMNSHQQPSATDDSPVSVTPDHAVVLPADSKPLAFVDAAPLAPAAANETVSGAAGDDGHRGPFDPRNRTPKPGVEVLAIRAGGVSTFHQYFP